jgi:hypothetical protein
MMSSPTFFPPRDLETLRGSGHYVPRSAAPLVRDHVLGVKLGEDVATLALIYRRNIDGVEHIDGKCVEREPFATYPELVSRLETLLRDIRARTEIVIALGPGGVAAFECFERLEPFGLVVTAGDDEQRDGRFARIGGRELVGRMHALVYDGRLRISPDMPLASALAGELRHAAFDDAARYDFTVALAAACWRVRATPALCVHYARAAARSRAPQPPSEPVRLLRLRRPAGSAVNIVQNARGRGSVAVDEHGCIALPADDAEPLIRAGWICEFEIQGA